MHNRYWFLTIATLYGLACVLPITDVTSLKPGPPVPGYHYLVEPGMQLLPPWWANVTMLVGCVCLYRHEWEYVKKVGFQALILSTLGVLIVGVQFGTCCWLGSIATLFLAGLVQSQAAQQTIPNAA